MFDFDPPKWFTAILPYLDKHSKFFIGILSFGMLYTVFSHWAKNSSTMKEYEIAVALIMLLVFLIFTIITFLKYMEDLSDLRRKKGVNLIAWAGFGEDPITTAFESGKKTPLDVLEYVRGLERLTSLKYRGRDAQARLFDVLISDIEYLKLHNVAGNLRPLDDNTGYGEAWQEISSDLAIRIKEQGEYFGIPVRCGLNDIVLNLELSKDKLPEPTIIQLEGSEGPRYNSLSYSDFSLKKLIETNPSQPPRIGLWNWYLPTLSVILLTKGISPVEAVWQQTREKIKEITDYIVDHKDFFVLYDTPESATRGLSKNEVWILLGGGSCLLPDAQGAQRKFKSVIPREGAILWVECVSALTISDVELSKSFIEFLLEKNVQIKLAEREAYRACPVTNQALNDIPARTAALAGKDSIFGTENRLRQDIYIRQLPPRWRDWQDCWDSVCSTKDIRHSLW